MIQASTVIFLWVLHLHATDMFYFKFYKMILDHNGNYISVVTMQSNKMIDICQLQSSQLIKNNYNNVRCSLHSASMLHELTST